MAGVVGGSVCRDAFFGHFVEATYPRRVAACGGRGECAKPGACHNRDALLSHELGGRGTSSTPCPFAGVQAPCLHCRCQQRTRSCRHLMRVASFPDPLLLYAAFRAHMPLLDMSAV